MSRSAKPQNGRRRFLRDVVRTAGGLAAVGVALGLQQQTARASGVRLRPPGAINENAFASACVRCGQCVQACPYDTLKLATLASGLSAGTPMVAAAFCAMSFAQQAGWLPWVWRWGYNSKPHAHLVCGCAPP